MSTQLKKEFSPEDLQRARNIITGQTGNRTKVQSGYEKKQIEHKEGDVWEENGKKWTIKDGFFAPQAAGIIHTDFERGFIKADIYHYEMLIKYGSEQKIKEAGKIRSEGKSYKVVDGDVIFFKFKRKIK